MRGVPYTDDDAAAADDGDDAAPAVLGALGLLAAAIAAATFALPAAAKRSSVSKEGARPIEGLRCEDVLGDRGA